MTQTNPFTVAAKKAAKDIKAGLPGQGTDDALALVDQLPSAADLVVDVMVEEGRRKRPNRALMEAYGMMLARGLSNWNNSVADGSDRIAALRTKLLTLCQGGEIPLPTMMHIYAQFDLADVDIGDELGKLVMTMAGNAPMSGIDDADIPAALVQQLSDVAEAIDNEFQLFEHLAESTASFSPDQRASFAALTYAPGSEKLRDAAIGWLLDPTAPVRAVVPTLILNGAPVSGTTLRRLIMLRNWLPDGDRPAVDAAVKLGRKAGVSFSPLPDVKVEEIHLSGWDGAGAQSLFLVMKDGRKLTLAAIMLKIGLGVRDAWVQRGMSKREVVAMMKRVHDEIGIGRGSLEYVRCAIGHALAVNADLGVPPPFGLLDVTEATGLTDLRANALSLESVLEQMVPPRNEKVILEALRASALWGETHPVAGSWFEDDEVLDTIVTPKRKVSVAMLNQVFAQVLENRRRHWAERFAWTALTMKMSAAPVNLWQDMAIIADELLRGRSLAEIPAMINIGYLTIEAHRARQRWGR